MALLILAAAVTAELVHAPFATNDGPVHVAFAKIIADYAAADSPLQSEVYAIDLRPNPNLASYLILVPLMKLVSPLAAEASLQMLCIAGPVLAGWVAIRKLGPENEFLAIALFPFALNQMFFFGLYNYSLSIAAFFIAIALYLRLDAAPTARRTVALASGLLLAFFSHAAGFVMAVAGIGAMAGAKVTIRSARGLRFATALWGQRHALAALLVPLPVSLLFVSATGGAPIEFGSSVFSRVDQFIHLTVLDVSSDLTRYVARGLRTALAAGVAWAMIRLATEKGRDMTPARFEQCLAIIAAGLTATLVMLFIPDTLGGGWTHFRRMLVFPYFWVVLLLACMPVPRTARIVAFFLACVASIAALASAVDMQRLVERQMSPLAEVDRRVGPHCTVVPIVLEPRPRDAGGQPLDIRFDPYFQAASRLELKDDRVVLFNYLARLDVYPVRFRPQADPQRYLFGWSPYQHDVRIRHIDIAGYERVSHLPVDYLLVWGRPSDPDWAMDRQLDAEAARSEVVYRSEDGWVTLYRRSAAKDGRCSAPDRFPTPARIQASSAR